MGTRMKRVLCAGMVLAGSSLFADDFTTSDATNGDVSPYTTTPWSAGDRFQITGVAVTGENSTSLNNTAHVNQNDLVGLPYLDDYSSTASEQSVDLYKGSSYDFSITLRDDANGTGWIDGQVWVDWNRDGDWDDAGEALGLIGNGSNLGQQERTLVKSITVPTDAATGKTRMRIRVADGGGADDSNMTPNSNSPVGYGYAQDYTVNLVVPAVSSISVVPITTGERVQGGFSSVELSLVKFGGNFDKIQQSPAGQNTWTDSTVSGDLVNDATVLVTGLTKNTAYDFRGVYNTSETTAVVSATTLAVGTTVGSVDYPLLDTYTVFDRNKHVTKFSILEGSTEVYAVDTTGDFNSGNTPMEAKYVDHTTTTPSPDSTLNIGTSYTFQIDYDRSEWHGMNIWADWNGDGDFLDEGEVIFRESTRGTAAQSATVTIPAGVTAGDVVIRARHYSADDLNVDGTGPWGLSNSVYPMGSKDFKVSLVNTDVEITGYESISDVVVRANDSKFDIVTEAQNLLPSTVTISGESDARTVSWTTESTPAYNNTVADTYVFTATLGAVPAGYKDDTPETVTANVVVTETFGVEAVGGYIQSTNNLAGGTDGALTLSGWVKVNSFSTGIAVPFQITDSAGKDLGVWINQTTGQMAVWRNDGNYRQEEFNVYNQLTNNNDWFHFAVTCKAGTDTVVYINGTAIVTSNRIQQGIGSGATLSIGAAVDTTAQVQNVVFDEVAVFNNVLSEETVGLIYNSGSGRSLSSDFDGLELYWKFGDVDASNESPAPTTVADSDNDADSNGTITGALNWVAGKPLAAETVTPAIGLELSLEGTELTWTVEDEVDVKEYRVVNAKTKEVIETVLAVGADFYSISVPEGVVLELVVVDNSGFSKSYAPADGNVTIEVYDLAEGWNLIAITSDDADLETLKNETVGVIWGWNGAGYEVVETASATDAVWVYSPIAKQVYVTGTKSDAKINLSIGWNMVGPVTETEVPADADTVYSWGDAVYSQIVEEHNVLIGGKGYWIFSL